MDAAFITYIALLGAAVGSFLNLSIDRLPLGLSLVSPPSRCDRCQRRIPLIDLVPLVNFAWLRGKCRYCKATIPIRVPVVEVLCAALFGLVAWKHGSSASTWVMVFYVSLFVAIFFIDLEQGLILNKVVFPGLAAAFVLFPFGIGGEERSVARAFALSAAGGGVGFGVMLLIYLASRGGMGEGDVKLGALMGVALGLRLVPAALYIAFITGGLVAVFLLLSKVKGRKEAVPFGPFLAAGTIAALLAGERIASWYLDFFR